MPNYKLMIGNNVAKRKEVDWKDSHPLYEFHTLKGIDELTTQFKNAEELKCDLIYTRCIPFDTSSANFTISYASKGETKYLMYGVAYEEDKKYLDPQYIIGLLMKDYEDIELLESLYNHYRNSFGQGINLDAISNYVNMRKRNVDIPNEDVSHLIYCLRNFVTRECYKYDNMNRCYIKEKDGSYKINYKSAHDLGMFMSNYYKKRALRMMRDELTAEKESKTESFKQISLTDFAKENKPKVKELGEYPNNHQITLFEYNKNLEG